MKNIIQELYYADLLSETAGKETDAATKQMLQKEEELLMVLDGDTKLAFLDYSNAWGEMYGEALLEAFTDGFQMGSKMMLEIFEE